MEWYFGLDSRHLCLPVRKTSYVSAVMGAGLSEIFVDVDLGRD